jgi:hypothetical protein
LGFAVGKPLDGLALRDRVLLTGKWIALEIYTPQTLPLRVIEAVGESARECIEALLGRGIDPFRFEFLLLPAAY